MRRLPYLTALDCMASGDYLFSSGTSDISKTIQLVTGSIYSHVAVIIRLDDIMPHYPRDRVFLVEAVGSGLELRNAREVIRHNLMDGTAYHWTRLLLTNDQRALAREFALVECGKGIPYDFSSLFKFLLMSPPIDYGQYICSEFGQACGISAGLDLPADRALSPRGLSEALEPYTVEVVDLMGPAG